jgi:hypothetical protein
MDFEHFLQVIGEDAENTGKFGNLICENSRQ